MVMKLGIKLLNAVRRAYPVSAGGKSIVPPKINFSLKNPYVLEALPEGKLSELQVFEGKKLKTVSRVLDSEDYPQILSRYKKITSKKGFSDEELQVLYKKAFPNTKVPTDVNYDAFVFLNNLAPEIGSKFDAHGLAKIGVADQLRQLNTLLSKGIDKNKPFYTAPLIVKNSAFILLNGIISSMIVLGTLPLFESTFQIITPYGLAELADHNQPLLKRLQIEAPGTYHHSLMVSNLCEAAAEAIGANPILARVGAFYHDIGKLKRPLFFVENQSYFGIENPHTKLNPRLSKMVITAHPKDGVELAKEYHLPSVINNFILQHHGEGLAKYFYNQAVQEEGIENVKEDQFRYTGPKPNMKETAILMIADAVESAVRSLKNPTPEEIDNIIDKIIVERLNDTQLADSPLTLHDIKVIAATFSRILRGMQHNRIKYQENIVEEFSKNKIKMPSKILDEDLENKIAKLEEQHSDEDKKDGNGDKN